MVLNLILALSIPLSLTIMGFFYYKIVLIFVKQDIEVAIEKVDKKEETQEIPMFELAPDVLDEYLNGERRAD